MFLQGTFFSDNNIWQMHKCKCPQMTRKYHNYNIHFVRTFHRTSVCRHIAGMLMTLNEKNPQNFKENIIVTQYYRQLRKIEMCQIDQNPNMKDHHFPLIICHCSGLTRISKEESELFCVRLSTKPLNIEWLTPPASRETAVVLHRVRVKTWSTLRSTLYLRHHDRQRLHIEFSSKWNDIQTLNMELC